MGKKSEIDICARECGAKCCRYITVHIDPPRLKVDQDEIRWFLYHEGTMVLREDRQWLLQVDVRCKYLTLDNLCSIYDRRPDVCRGYDMTACDYCGDDSDRLVFRTAEEFDAFLEERRKQRNARRRARRKKAKN